MSITLKSDWPLWIVVLAETALAIAGIVLCFVDAESRFLLPVVLLRAGVVGIAAAFAISSRLWAIWTLVVLEGGVACVGVILFTLIACGGLAKSDSNAALIVAASGTGLYGFLTLLSVLAAWRWRPPLVGKLG